MATAFATYPETVQLHERVSAAGFGKVDKAAGVIYGVRVLGPDSKNRRRYAESAIKAAIPLYQNCRVNYDHPRESGRDRPMDDRAGWLESVRFVAGGLTADLHLFVSDPRAGKLMEAAERRPESFGLSHNVSAETRNENGMTIVEKIVRVESVDIVSDPATTRSLFESESIMMYSTYPRDAREFAERLIEGDDLPMADVVPPVDDQAAGLDGDRELLALQKAVIDAIESAKSAADLVAKLQALVDARGATSAEPAAESCMPSNAYDFAEAISEGHARLGRTLRPRTSADMPNNAAEFAAALFD